MTSSVINYLLSHRLIQLLFHLIRTICKAEDVKRIACIGKFAKYSLDGNVYCEVNSLGSFVCIFDDRRYYSGYLVSA
jgi:hypothetical protein